jgi:RNA polymerase sigma factor (sigma-70 family)
MVAWETAANSAMLTATADAAVAVVPDRIALCLGEVERQAYLRAMQETEYVAHPSFSDPAAEAKFGCELNIELPQWIGVTDDGEEVRWGAGRSKALRGFEEEALFLGYNYARYRLAALVAQQRRESTLPRAREIIRWHERAMKVRADLVRANLPLVLAMVKRARGSDVEFAEAVSEGNLALLRSVEKFDVARGFKFSTYACRAILKGMARLAMRAGRYRRHFAVAFDPELERSDEDSNRHERQHQASLETLRQALSSRATGLTDLERRVVTERFAICCEDTKKRTLAQVGKVVGLSNERVCQIQNSALWKLRVACSQLQGA